MMTNSQIHVPQHPIQPHLANSRLEASHEQS